MSELIIDNITQQIIEPVTFTKDSVPKSKLNSLFFELQEEKIFVLGKPVEGKKALVRTDTLDTVGIVSNKYSALSNSQVMRGVEDILGQAGFKYELIGGSLRRSGGETCIEVSFPEQTLTTSRYNEKMELRGYVTNAFDGKGAVKIQVGFMRFICANGAMLGKSDYSLSVRHLSRVDEKVIDTFTRYLVEAHNNATGFVTALEHRSITEADVKYLIGSSYMPDKYKVDVYTKWKNEKSDNAWDLYNDFTNIVTHSIRANDFSKRETLARLTSDFNNYFKLAA